MIVMMLMIVMMMLLIEMMMVMDLPADEHDDDIGHDDAGWVIAVLIIRIAVLNSSSSSFSSFLVKDVNNKTFASSGDWEGEGSTS